GIAALLAGLGFACALLPEQPPVPQAPARDLGALRVSDVEVETSAQLAPSGLRSLSNYEVPEVLRQSTLDWLEQHQRFGRQGELRVEIRVEALHLRSAFAARWWPGLGAPDRLAVRVTLHRGEVRLHGFEAFVESRLGGNDWGDPRERARRLARRLGQRVAGLL
ncbi:MAG: hypothetical protein VCB99_00235, partial [Myxococcota bacterium]